MLRAKKQKLLRAVTLGLGGGYARRRDERNMASPLAPIGERHAADQ